LAQKKKVAFASRITYYLRRPENVSIFENGPQKVWLPSKNSPKTAFFDVFRPVEPLRGPFFRPKMGSRRGSSPVFGCFFTKNRAGTPPKTRFFAFLTFFDPFLAQFGPFLDRFWGF
jgi:hypothetical protein